MRGALLLFEPAPQALAEPSVEALPSCVVTSATPISSRTESEHAQKIAVLLPCFNEEATIGKVVADFRRALPGADVFVFDNVSDDDTARVAAEAGAVVVRSPRRGKGNVVRHMFETVEADVYVMADGDDTYPAQASVELIRVLLETKADMVVGTRLQEHAQGAFRALHEFGNKFISKLISVLFSAPVTDVLSGYRVLNRDFVNTLYLKSSGFEIETEITLQALVKNRVIQEVPVRYGERPAGSHSKLSTFSDGALILRGVLLVFRDYKPLVFFSCVSGVCFVLGLVAGWYPVSDYARTQFVSHVPLALLAAALEVLAVLFFGIGLILNAIARFHIESQGMVGNLIRRLGRDRDRS
jgi:glycosyltransferase involved in cell wall biosynthesis